MAQFNVNMSATFKAIPKGEYLSMIKEAEVRPARARRPEDEPNKELFPNLLVKFEVIDGEYTGEKFEKFFSFNPNAEPMLRAFIVACSLAAPDAQGAMQFETEQLLGICLYAKGKPETFNGRERFSPDTFRVYTEPAKPQAPSTQSASPANAAPPQQAPVQQPARQAQTAQPVRRSI